ncbi:hypothetical protein BDZ45DRAFT_680756 [Acephala macrosclerotiorum]|nr:hypothetical protein BDZ45DRAFT_680756 [Acephala macrosclerotiorum]
MISPSNNETSMVIYTAQLPSPINSAGENSGVHSPQSLQEAQSKSNDQRKTQDTNELVEAQKTTLSTLPTDIILLIANCFNATESTCFALAFKSFYLFHFARRGKVSLSERPRELNKPGLTVLISSYFPGLVFYPHVDKFIPLARRDALELERFERWQLRKEALALRQRRWGPKRHERWHERDNRLHRETKEWDEGGQEFAFRRGQEWREEVHGIRGILGRVRQDKVLGDHLEMIYRAVTSSIRRG